MVAVENAWVRGQRWASDSEPELGLGIILSGADGRVEIVFPAAGEQRCYALDSAPLRRVRFLPGDRIKTHTGAEMTVERVREENGLRIHETEAGDVPEAELCDSISFSKPEERLFGGKLDDVAAFDLRGEALRRRADMRRSPVRGLAGARMDLIPHQLFIADEVANRPVPRVLLADEVGLGKTIEACLIIHRLLLTGRASRVLVLVPEPLVHQWFVELHRRFQLSFEIFDESRCEAIEEGDPEGNPFLDSQWVLASIDFLANDERRTGQAREAGWDVLVVDEAHHLEWSPEEPGAAYEMVRSLAAETEGLLLLTATPQQLGPEGHFARLQLLDPERYSDLARFEKESAHYEEIADIVERIDAGEDIGASLDLLVAGRKRLEQSLARFRSGVDGAREKLVSDLLDGFGMGRVMFRNTRAHLGGFPGREPNLVKLKGKEGFVAAVNWVCKLLKELGDEKVLIIANTVELASAVMEAIQEESGVKGALFHEELTLLQRDRNAAYFAEPDGARILVCSEIGSEGRNFQFARHLVLFDVPEDIDVLEQRIGRLDRIGQKGIIRIHVPYIAGMEEALVRWMDEGLDAFRHSVAGGAEIQWQVQDELNRALDGGKPAAVKKLLARTAEVRAEVSERLARGQDRLLERSSHRPAKSAALVEGIQGWDADKEFEDFVIRLFEHSGVDIEELDPRRYFLKPGNLKSDAFPALPDDGITITFDRRRALGHEHEAFMTWDHPMVRGALDLMLGTADGNACFALWETGGDKRMLLEAWVVVEAIAPAKLHVERFLPQTPVRIMVDHLGNVLTDDATVAAAKLRRSESKGLLKNESVKRKVLPAMLTKIRDMAVEQSRPIIQAAQESMFLELSAEISRLKDLASVNDHVRPEEIAALELRKAELAKAISAARPRIDAVRLIWKAPAAPKKEKTVE
ncbi:DEAD/DEAH box helicase family protein [Luteolibacter ambystomatis]|uniref:DEAD/DEAH box helicase family protein n=1 Tax=Luteolibacter ambystomatis TaxID=2824561 RepID=A0A975G6Y9_9BACT|nr:helicase-related protein [Luteolibacter ambystomatis]QUE49925.1 DEAD/DEAH box helicase family protein [Luteolibacter ambystomatis]